MQTDNVHTSEVIFVLARDFGVLVCTSIYNFPPHT